jgi:hypothetical protein
MYKRLKPFALMTLITLSSVMSLIGAFMPTAVNAVVNPTSANDKTFAYSYYKVVAACFQHAAIDKNIDSSKANSPSDWVNDSLFGINPTLKTGFLINSDGADSCKSVIGKAVSFWQISPVEFLKGVGYQLNSNGSQYVYSGTNQQSDFTGYINRMVPGSGTKTPVITYTLDLTALTAGCKPSSLGPIADIKDEAVVQQINSNTNDYFAATLVNGDGSTTVNGYQGGSVGINNYGNPGDQTGSSTYNCRSDGVAANVSNDARALATSIANDLYLNLSNTLYSGLQSVRDANCNSQPNGLLRTECQDSWRNAFNTCYATYQNTASLGAKNGPNGDTSTFILPTDTTVNTMAICIAKATGASAKDIHDALASSLASYQPPSSTPIVSGGATGPTKSSCQVDGIGWIICPVINFLANIADQAYKVVDGLLTVPPLNTDINSAANGAYVAWSIMRNFANIAFVIAFILIIYSQLTSAGVSNYGVKKLLPKLIIAAILVNLSYWICAIAIDLSNIIGSSTKDLLDSVAAKMPTSLGDPLSTGGLWQSIAVSILGGVIAVYLGLSIFLPIIITVVAAIVAVLIVLVLRQALIVMLIVISPLAFVALLLPNTEHLFKRWRELFTTMLVMFPVIAFVFGGSTLASRIIGASALSLGGDASVNSWFLKIVAAGVAVIPLFVTPIIMKASGGLLSRFAGVVNNPNKGLFDRMRKGADGFRERQEGRRAIASLNKSPNLSFGKYRRSARRNAIASGIKAEQTRAEQQYVASKIANGDEATAFGRKVAGGGIIGGAGADPAAIQRALANAKFTIEKAELEEVKAASVLIESKGIEALQEIISSPAKSATQKAAALERLVQIGDPGHYEEAVNTYGHDTSEENSIIRKTLSRSLAENGPQFLKAPDLDAIKNGKLQIEEPDGSITKLNLADVARRNVASGVYSQEKMVVDSNGSLNFALSSADSAGRELLMQTANDLIKNETLRGKIKHNRAAINTIAGVSESEQIPGQGTFF